MPTGLQPISMLYIYIYIIFWFQWLVHLLAQWPKQNHLQWDCSSLPRDLNLEICALGTSVATLSPQVKQERGQWVEERRAQLRHGQKVGFGGIGGEQIKPLLKRIPFWTFHLNDPIISYGVSSFWWCVFLFSTEDSSTWGRISCHYSMPWGFIIRVFH